MVRCLLLTIRAIIKSECPQQHGQGFPTDIGGTIPTSMYNDPVPSIEALRKPCSSTTVAAALEVSSRANWGKPRVHFIESCCMIKTMYLLERYNARGTDKTVSKITHE